MSSSDFEAELRQSVADNIALISNAAKAAKARIGQSVAGVRPPPPAEPADFEGPRPTVNFAAEEPSYASDLPFAEPAFDEGPMAEEPAFAEASPFADALPDGAINVDDFAMEGVDDEGIPVWEDPP